jgi:transposase-like protein
VHHLCLVDPVRARKYFEHLRWPAGPLCPNCGIGGQGRVLKGSAHRDGLLQCGACRKQYTVTIGTALEGTKIPLNKWLAAVRIVLEAGERDSTLPIHKLLGVSKTTASMMAGLIRDAKSGVGVRTRFKRRAAFAGDRRDPWRAPDAAGAWAMHHD